MRCEFLLSLTLLACVPDPDVEPSPCRNPLPAIAQLGGGNQQTGFVPLPEGATALVTLGPQGLHMITVSMRLQGFEMPPAGAKVGGRVTVAVRVGSKLLGSVESDLKPVALPDGSLAFLGAQPRMTADNVNDYFGRPAEVEMRVNDGCDRPIFARRVLTLVQ